MQYGKSRRRSCSERDWTERSSPSSPPRPDKQRYNCIIMRLGQFELALIREPDEFAREAEGYYVKLAGDNTFGRAICCPTLDKTKAYLLELLPEEVRPLVTWQGNFDYPT